MWRPPRNIRLVLFVYTSAAEFRAVRDGTSLRKNPAVAAAGPVTRSLSGSWTRKKRCLHREATLHLLVCQHSVRFEQIPAESQGRKEMTHMKSNSLVRSLALVAALAIS